MERIQAKTIDECITNLNQLRNYQPFRYSGTWYAVQTEPETFSLYATKQSAVQRGQALSVPVHILAPVEPKRSQTPAEHDRRKRLATGDPSLQD